jgi:hypothetical protein
LGGDLDKFFEKLKGATFTFTLGPKNRITKFEGYAEWIKKLTPDMEEVAKVIKSIITEDAIKQATQDIFAILPDEPVSKGKTWKSNSSLPLGPFGTIKEAIVFTYQGKDNTGHKITSKSEVKYVLPKKGDAFADLLKVVRGDLKSDGGKGTYIFDADKGRLINRTASVNLKGQLTLEVAGQQISLDLTLNQTTTSRLMDRANKD